MVVQGGFRKGSSLDREWSVFLGKFKDLEHTSVETILKVTPRLFELEARVL